MAKTPLSRGSARRSMASGYAARWLVRRWTRETHNAAGASYNDLFCGATLRSLLQSVHHGPHVMEGMLVGGPRRTLMSGDLGLEVVVVGFLSQAGQHL